MELLIYRDQLETTIIRGVLQRVKWKELAKSSALRDIATVRKKDFSDAVQLKNDDGKILFEAKYVLDRFNCDENEM